MSQLLSYDRKTGSEGPKYDPYSYEETTVEFRGHKVEIHLGLAVWIKVDGKDVEVKQDALIANDIFEGVLGFSLADLEKWEHRLKSKCRECGSKRFKHAGGYPGDHFVLCAKCDNVVDYYFNIKEVE